MKIDSHQHFWKFDPIRDSWIDDSMKVLQNDFLPKDLKPILKSNDIDGCIAVQADQSETETKFLLELAKENEFVKGVVGWIDLKASNIEERLEYYSDQHLLKGIRHIVQAEKDGFMLNAQFQNGISKLKDFNLTYDILIFPHHLQEAQILVKKNPNQTFIIDHLAKPYIKKGAIDQWKTDMEEIAQYDHVACKLSGMVTEADWSNWNYNQLEPYIDVVFNAFDTDRILYGSDWPVCQLAANYKEQISVFQKYTASLSESEQSSVFGLNAIKTYKL